jgi:heme-degrading monooxygenase HmoA
MISSQCGVATTGVYRFRRPFAGAGRVQRRASATLRSGVYCRNGAKHDPVCVDEDAHWQCDHGSGQSASGTAAQKAIREKKMAVTRVFRVRIDPSLREEFEQKFATISVHVAQSAEGNTGVDILRPTQWEPEEYAMISQWRDTESLRQFAGESWNEAVIPAGMDKYIRSCWVHHYESWK